MLKSLALKNEALGLLAVALLALVVAIFASGTRTGRLAGLAVPEEPFRHVYVLGRVGSDQKCLVTDRAGATVRRSEPDLAGSRWRCHWGAGEVASRTLVAVTGKEPSYVFVPAGQVFDPVFPWVYEAVRDRLRAPRELRDLPRLRWVHLYHDRLYQGFHLQLRLPDRRFAERRGLGRTELISVLGDRAWCWNRKLRGACRLWNEAFVAEAIFPEPLVTPATRLLDSLLPPEASRAYFLTETSRGAPPREPPAGAPFAAWAEPVPPRDGEAMPVDLMPGAWRAERQPVVPLVGNLHPLPLPFALEEVLATVPAEEPRDRGGLYVDARFRAWGRLGGSPWSEDPRWVIELARRVFWGVEVGTPVARAVHRTDPAGLPSAEAVTEALIAAFGAHRRAAAALGGAAPSGAAPDGGAGQPEIWHVLEASPSLGLLEALAQPAGGGEG